MPPRRSKLADAKPVARVRRLSPSPSKRGHARPSKHPEAGTSRCVEKEHILSIFQQLDFTGSGKIQYGELAAVLKLCDCERWTDAMLGKLFDSMDINHDSIVDLDEFLEWAWGSMHEATGGFDDVRKALELVSRQESSTALPRHQPLILTPKSGVIALDSMSSVRTRMESVRHMCLLLAAMSQQSDEGVQVMHGLWLGSKRDALNLEWQEKVGIRAILNMASDDVEELHGKYPKSFRTLFIPAEDSEYPLLERHLPDAFMFVESCLSEVPIRPVLVHCVQGLNRSGTIVVACLMLLQRRPLLNALFEVSQLRCDVVNNPDFQEQLINLACCNGLLIHATETEVALEQHSRLREVFFGVFAAGAPGALNLTSESFRSGLQRVAPELDFDDMAQLEMRLGWFRDDGIEGVAGVAVADLCSWLASDSLARRHVLQPLLKHVGVDVCVKAGSVIPVTKDVAPLPAEAPSSRRIDEIGNGLFICAVQALENTDVMDALGIKSVINCAHGTLYDAEVRDKLFARYHINILGADDDDTQDLLALVDPAIDLIAKGLRLGGVAVHCAAGISRSSAVCLAFLMLRRGLSLAAAFRRVFRARNVIRPNHGFWRQLRDLEAGLLTRGVLVCTEDDWTEEDNEAFNVLQRLDKQAADLRAEHTLYLVADAHPCTSAHLEAVRSGVRANILWDSLDLDGNHLLVRAALANEAGRDDLKACLQELCGAGVSVKVE